MGSLPIVLTVEGCGNHADQFGEPQNPHRNGQRRSQIPYRRTYQYVDWNCNSSNPAFTLSRRTCKAPFSVSFLGPRFSNMLCSPPFGLSAVGELDVLGTFLRVHPHLRWECHSNCRGALWPDKRGPAPVQALGLSLTSQPEKCSSPPGYLPGVSSGKPDLLRLVDLDDASILNDQLHDAEPDTFHSLLNGLDRKQGRFRRRRGGSVTHKSLLDLYDIVSTLRVCETVLERQDTVPDSLHAPA